MPQYPQITAGDIGVAIVINTNGFNATGFNVSVQVKSQTEPIPSEPTSFSGATISPDGSTVTYVTTGAEFPEAGLYAVWCVFTATGLLYTSNPPIIMQALPQP